jgi:putative zinc finger protein
MTERRPLTCDDVQMAALAQLDGERAALTTEDIEIHLTGCEVCRDAVANLTALHAKLDGVDYGRPDVDLWPMVRTRISAVSPHPLRRERGAFIALAAVLGTWRLAQLLLEMPMPVINSAAPLALLILVLWRYVGDPFAIRITPAQLEQEGVS